jgi:hypothetical protein
MFKGDETCADFDFRKRVNPHILFYTQTNERIETSEESDEYFSSSSEDKEDESLSSDEEIQIK